MANIMSCISMICTSIWVGTAYRQDVISFTGRISPIASSITSFFFMVEAISTPKSDCFSLW